VIFDDLDFDAGSRIVDTVIAVADDGCTATTRCRCRRGFAVGLEPLVTFDVRDLKYQIFNTLKSSINDVRHVWKISLIPYLNLSTF
jgi:hypothetical protein